MDDWWLSFFVLLTIFGSCLIVKEMALPSSTLHRSHVVLLTGGALYMGSLIAIVLMSFHGFHRC